MDTEDIRAPVLWRRPHAKIYSYNQEFGGNYYQPMIDYVETKERQGIFFERPTERIHLPDPAEQCMKKHETGVNTVSGVSSLDKFLVKAYSQQTKEINGSTVHTQNLMLRGSKENTSLHPKLTATMLRDHYVKELHLIKARGSPYA
eukprot:GFUD01024496.1.p1 GENE.GFUD01024496.1~~GFUD01024496.1.p1  ORF type:complete len:146 (+),score=50.72 GFUD01024496.1:44-481(+)